MSDMPDSTEPELGTRQGNFSTQNTKQQKEMNSSGALLNIEGEGHLATGGKKRKFKSC